MGDGKGKEGSAMLKVFIVDGYRVLALSMADAIRIAAGK